MIGRLSVDPLADLIATPTDELRGALQKTLPRLLHALRQHLGMDVAFVSEFTEGRRVFRHVDAADPGLAPKVDTGDPLEQTYCQRIVDGRMPELIADTAADAQAQALEVTRTLAIGSYLGVPLCLGDGAVYGTLCCYSVIPDHTLNERDLGMLRVVADMAADLIDHDLESHREEREITRDVLQALNGQGMSSVYQPILDLETADPVGFEALARFGDAMFNTEHWFDNAARIGREVDLELHAAALALRGLEHLPSDCYLSINLSADTLVSPGLDDLLRDAPMQRLVLEITERAPILRYEALLDALARYRGRGARIAVDDAGAGYASFRHILVLEPDLIKLDKSLVSNIDVDASRRELASALIQFANKTGSALVAEGVETATELAALKRMGVGLAQGYYLGRPVTLGQLQH